MGKGIPPVHHHERLWKCTEACGLPSTSRHAASSWTCPQSPRFPRLHLRARQQHTLLSSIAPPSTYTSPLPELSAGLSETRPTPVNIRGNPWPVASLRLPWRPITALNTCLLHVPESHAVALLRPLRLRHEAERQPRVHAPAKTARRGTGHAGSSLTRKTIKPPLLTEYSL